MYQGSCHCGAVKFSVDVDDISEVNECNCSHCQRKGFLLIFLPRNALQIDSGESSMTNYTFNKHVITHKFCPTCGTQPFAVGVGPDGSEMAAVNARCVDGIDIASIKRIPIDGKSF